MANQQVDKVLKGKVAVVTGASSGIGLAIVHRLVEAGASVVLAARREEKLQEVKQTIEKNGGNAIVVKTDVKVRQQVKDLIKVAEDSYGPVDILVNNAGVLYLTLMKNVKEDEWDNMIDINCKGVTNGIGAVLPGMVARGKGQIVNISSDTARGPMACLAVYSGTKHFVEGLSKSLRLELEGTEVKITSVQPGYTVTELIRNDVDLEAIEAHEKRYPNFPNVKPLSADDVARAVLYAVTQPPGVAVNEVLVEPTDQYTN